MDLTRIAKCGFGLRINDPFPSAAGHKSTKLDCVMYTYRSMKHAIHLVVQYYIWDERKVTITKLLMVFTIVRISCGSVCATWAECLAFFALQLYLLICCACELWLAVRQSNPHGWKRNYNMIENWVPHRPCFELFLEPRTYFFPSKLPPHPPLYLNKRPVIIHSRVA